MHPSTTHCYWQVQVFQNDLMPGYQHSLSRWASSLEMQPLKTNQDLCYRGRCIKLLSPALHSVFELSLKTLAFDSYLLPAHLLCIIMQYSSGSSSSMGLSILALWPFLVLQWKQWINILIFFFLDGSVYELFHSSLPTVAKQHQKKVMNSLSGVAITIVRNPESSDQAMFF